MTDPQKEAEQLTANCTHGMEFAETAEHYADLRARIRACIAYQIIERDRARSECQCAFRRLTVDLLTAIATANANGKSGYDTLAQDDWENVLRLAECVRLEAIGAAQ